MRTAYYTLHHNAVEPAFASVLPTASVAAAVESMTGRYPGAWLGKNLSRKGVCYCASRNPRRGVVVRHAGSPEARRLADLAETAGI